MDLQSLSLPLFCTFIVFFFMVIRLGKSSKLNKPAPKLPPGPWKLPVVGNLHQLFGSLPHHSLRDLAKKHGPLVHLQLGEVSSMIVSSPKTAEEIMNSHDIIFSQRPSFLAPKIISYDCTNIIFSPYGGYWRQLRKICMMELLSASRVKSFRSIREDEVSNLIQVIHSSERYSPINLTTKIFSLTYGITSRAAFGKKSKDQEEFISVVKELVELAAGFSLADLYPSLEAISGMRPKLEKRQRQTDRILGDIINEHKERKKTANTGDVETEDLVDVLLRLQDSVLKIPISDNNIKAVIMDIFSAGSDTSSTTLDWAMSELLKNPYLMAKAQAEVRQVFHEKGNVDEEGIGKLNFLRSVIKETLRLHPSVPLIPRECSECCTINGWEIPAKSRVIVNTWAIGRDPKYWTEAERFNPERFLNSCIDFKGMDFEYIPFGAGRRICPAISFGLANIELPLAQLLYHFDWELPKGMKHEDLNMTETVGATVRRKEEMILIPIPYQPLHA